MVRDLYRLERHDIDSCNECGACEKACGLKIPITDRLKEARQLLAEHE